MHRSKLIIAFCRYYTAGCYVYVNVQFNDDSTNYRLPRNDIFTFKSQTISTSAIIKTFQSVVFTTETFCFVAFNAETFRLVPNLSVTFYAVRPSTFPMPNSRNTATAE